MEYDQAVNGILLYGNILMQSCNGDNDKQQRVLKAVNNGLEELSIYVRLNANIGSQITNSQFDKELRKIMNLN